MFFVKIFQNPQIFFAKMFQNPLLLSKFYMFKKYVFLLILFLKK